MSASESFLDRGDESPGKDVVDAVLALVNAPTWEEAKRVVEARPEELLTDAADRVFPALLEQHEGDAAATGTLQEHRALLARCRRDGVDAAFADRLPEPEGGPVPDAIPDELRALVIELTSLGRPSEMASRVEVCRAALRLVNRDAQPEIWASLQVTLADSLAQNPLGDQADNLERAIEHHQRALEIYTRRAFPADWALSQTGLGMAYRRRIRGERAENVERAEVARAMNFSRMRVAAATAERLPRDRSKTG